jgi:hypothetical protein
VEVGDQVDELTETGLVERRTRVVLGEDALEGGVVPLHRFHRSVHQLPDAGLAGVLLELRPPGFRRYPEDILRAVLVGGLGVRVGLREELLPVLLKSIGDVLQEDEPQDHVLVLRRV